MDIPELQAFVTVAETQSFSLAAEKLFITQPAVSKRIASLEEDVGTSLFDRIGRQIQLTEAGHRLVDRARRILMEIEDTKRDISNLSGEINGHLSVGTSHHIGLHRLPPILRHYSQRYPNVQLDIHFVDSEEAYDSVYQGKLELGIVTLPPHSTHELTEILIWEDPLVFVIAPNHPLAGSGDIEIEELSPYSAILPSEATFTRRIVEALFKEKSLDIDVAMSTNYLETIRMMVSIGLGWSVLPATMIDGTIISVNVLSTPIQRRLGLVYHPSRSLSNAGKKMVDLLLDQKNA